MSRSFLCVSALLVTAAFSPSLPRAEEKPRPAAPAALKMSPVDRGRLATALKKDGPKVADKSIVVRGPQRYAVLFVEFASERACADFAAPAGATVFNRFRQFAELYVTSLAAAEAVTEAAGVRWAQLHSVVTAPPTPELTKVPGKTKALNSVVRGGLNGLTGKGVVVAVLDTGIDFRHPDFVLDTPSGKASRILYFWDTLRDHKEGAPGKPGPLKYPNGAAIGTVYTREELTADLRADKSRIPELDTGGHGTCCAGIAAGNGRGDPGKSYVGVAPGADLIGVRLGAVHNIENAYLLNAACAWIDKKVGTRPVVVNCSFGGHLGSHDGYSVQERHISARFALDRKGRAICISAGNQRQLPSLHGLATFAGPLNKGALTWSAGQGGLLGVYVDTASPDDVVVETAGLGTSKLHRYVSPLSGSLVLEAEVALGARGEMKLHSKSGARLQAHGFIANGIFTGPCVTRTHLLGTPGTAHNAITVGSFDFNDGFDEAGIKARYGPDGRELNLGSLSFYSSPGPLRKGGPVKPDVVSPGQFHVAAAAKGSPGARDRTGHYRKFNGTSASSPYTAGVIALMLEKKPALTTGEIKALFQKHAVKDDFTGGTPNREWGNGKLEYFAVKRILDALR